MRGDAIEALRELLADESTRPATVARLVPELPPSALRYAFSAAEYALERGEAEAMRAVAARVVEHGDPAFLKGTGATVARFVRAGQLLAFADLAVAMPVGSPADAWERAEVLATVAMRLARAGRPDAGLLLLELAARRAGSEEPIAEAAAVLAPAVQDRATAERLLALTADLSPPARAATLIGLAERLSAEEAEELTRLVGELQDETLGARLLVVRLRRLPEGERRAIGERVAAELGPVARAILLLGLGSELARAGVAAAVAWLRDLAAKPGWTSSRWEWEAVDAASGVADSEERGELAAAMRAAAETAGDRRRAGTLRDLARELDKPRQVPPTGPPRPSMRRPTAGEIAAARARKILDGVAEGDRAEVALYALVPQMAAPPPADEWVEPALEDDEAIAAAVVLPEWLPDGDLDDLDDIDELDELDEFDDFEVPEHRAAEKRRPAARRPAPVVSTGFTEPGDPDGGVSPRQPLHPGDWLFWLELGAPHAASIETRPVGLLASVPAGSTVTVVLYPLTDGVEVLERSAELEVRPDGSGDRRLRFPVRIAAGVDRIELRCSIFRRGLLVQSRRIRAAVADRPSAPGSRPVLRSELDYLLLRRLAPDRLRRVPEHGVSLMLNGDGDTHHLHALVADGEQPQPHSARFEGGEVQDLIDQARRALRQAAFGSPEPWREGDAYRYGGPGNRELLEEDLIVLAIRGFRFYDACINRLTGGGRASRDFEDGTRRPTRVQVAHRRHGGLLLPAALFYDHPLDTTEPDLRVCPEFLAALDGGGSLEELRCFAGDCPGHDNVTVVCPSGFWGYRHDLGLPLSIGHAGGMAFEIRYDREPEIGMAVSTDPRFELRAAHEQELRALRPGLGWRYAATRPGVIRLMRDGAAHLLYFYCHGGVTESNAPFLGVGASGEPGITSDVFRAHRIVWENPRPLVFINGCHTTALEPNTALSFVSRLVDTAEAAGVIGTEITTFEPLAGAFATACLRRFLEGAEIGAAVRGARLELLARANPLGLIYVPFVLPSLRLVERSAG
jgi:hypothetical protein